LVLGPPRSGKTRGLIIPNVAAWEGPVVITDSSSLDTPEGDTQAARQALAARSAGAHPALAATTLLKQAKLAAAAAAELATVAAGG
jgi:hypothetical protein